MTIGLAFFLPILLLAILAQFRKPPRRDVEDSVSRRHRTITHNAFKARIGRPYREYK